MTAISKGFYEALNKSAAVPAKSPRERVVDQDGVPITGYDVLSGIFLVKL
jgi:hypothetical protein